MVVHLGLDVIAEGVETEEELNYMKNKDCKLFQGYYFSKPLSGGEFNSLCLQEKHSAKLENGLVAF